MPLTRPSASLIGELEDSLRNGSPEKRAETLRRVTGLFLNEADALNDQQIAVFDDVLLHLVERIESRALAELSATLAPVDSAPVATVRRLALDEDIAVAGPVLTQSARLTDGDLVEIARSRGQGHLLAISGRASLAESVTDILVERGDGEVTHRLAENAGARFSAAGFAAMVEKAESDQALTEKLGLRLDLPIQLLRALLQRATDLVRERLLCAAAPDQRWQIQSALADIARDVGREAAGPRNFTAAEGVVQQLNRDGKLNETLLAGFVRDRRYEEMVATLALLSGSDVETIESLMRNVRSDGLIVACKAAGVSWLTLSAILKGRIAHHTVSAEELDEAKKAYLTLSQVGAQRTMRFMQVQQTTKKQTIRKFG